MIEKVQQRGANEHAQWKASSGILLLLCAALALGWANTHAASYQAVFEYPLAIPTGSPPIRFSVRALINDGLMTLFFLVVGIEIKRELVVGELNTIAKATLPAFAALGGMVVPACLFVAFNSRGLGLRGWGIPMATDIALCIGIFALLKTHVPRGLVVFITALAIFDDIGGVLVIALFYGHSVSVAWLCGASVLSLILLGMNRGGVMNGLAYALVGCGLWYGLHRGGVHATIAGIVLGLMIPTRSQRVSPPRFAESLHLFVSFVVMPLFALANAGVSMRGGVRDAASPVALGTALGLFVGKPLGVFGMTVLSIKLRLAEAPASATRIQLFGAAILTGMGFTVALFIGDLAYDSAPELLDQAKVGVLLGTIVSGILGFVVLRLCRSASPAPCRRSPS